MADSSAKKRNLPSWMSSRDDDGENLKKDPVKSDSGPSLCNAGFSRLMEGVVFVLSGFVNPERSDLRSKMLEMGSEYQPDWNTKCTLLICAFGSTPKFRQVESDGGTIVSKEWIVECYNQKKLVDIEPYLLHPGKPWRRQPLSRESEGSDTKPSKPIKHVKGGKGSPSKKVARSAEDNSISNAINPSKAKRWAAEDLARTISWLESQEEKPEPSEIQRVAGEGILTCIQDAIDALQAGQGMEQVTELWACVPRLVEELARLDKNMKDTSREGLCKEAMACKAIYELEFLVQRDDIVSKKRPRSQGEPTIEKTNKNATREETSYDSDSTVKMTEEEIDQAYNSIATSL